MKKLTKKITVLLTAVMCANMFTACGTGKKGTCKAASVIAFLAGDGQSRSVYGIGELVTMELNYKVTSETADATPVNKVTSENAGTPVKAILTIPNVKGIEAKYKDGQDIPSEYNSKKNVTTYVLTANASKDAEIQECVIKFRPNQLGNQTLTLVYDDHVDASYDVNRTIEMVQAYIDEGICEVTDTVDFCW